MGITIRTMTTVMGRSGKPERPSFFPIRAHLLTTCPQCRRWYPSRWSGRALCEADCALFGERQAMPPSLRASVVIACTAGRSVFARCSSAANCCPLSGQPAIRLRKPATGSFVAVMDDATPHRPFSFVSAKETKPPLTGAERK